MITKLIAAAAVAGSLLVLAPQSAFAAGQTGTVTVPAGDRRCIDLPVTATNNAQVNDFVVSGHKVKFVFLVKRTGATSFVEVSSSGSNPVSSYGNYITSATNPTAFPGVFRTCANNMSDKTSTVQLSLTTDA